jgi:tetraacyldisaccharide-1-P 4'-kinase
LVVLTRVRGGDPADEAIRTVRAAGYSGPIVRAGHRTVGFTDAAGAPCAPPKRALAFCGIGDPGLFRDDLSEAGVATPGFRAFRDHQPYSVAGWEALAEEAKALGVPLVTTEKDLSRLEAEAGESLARAELIVLRIETVVWDEALLVEAIGLAVSARPRSTSP